MLSIPPRPPRHVCAAQRGVRRSLQHVSPHAGSAAAMARWPLWGVSERFQDLPFQRLSRGRSGQIFREAGTQRARPVLNPSKTLGPAAPYREAEPLKWQAASGSCAQGAAGTGSGWRSADPAAEEQGWTLPACTLPAHQEAGAEGLGRTVDLTWVARSSQSASEEPPRATIAAELSRLL